MNLLSDRFWHRLINGAYFHCVFRVRFPLGEVSFLSEVYSSLFDWFQAIWLRAYLRFMAWAGSINTNDSMIRNSVDTFSLLYLWMWLKVLFLLWLVNFGVDIFKSIPFRHHVRFVSMMSTFLPFSQKTKDPKNIFWKVNHCVCVCVCVCVRFSCVSQNPSSFRWWYQQKSNFLVCL